MASTKIHKVVTSRSKTYREAAQSALTLGGFHVHAGYGEDAYQGWMETDSLDALVKRYAQDGYELIGATGNVIHFVHTDENTLRLTR